MILIIGCGNTLRRDDGIGVRLVEALAGRLDGAAYSCMTVHQLTPELVEPIRRADYVVFVDARVDGDAGAMLVQTILPESATGDFTHHVTPSLLLDMARDWDGQCPYARLFTIVGSDFELGESLSSTLQAHFDDYLTSLANIVRGISAPD